MMMKSKTGRSKTNSRVDREKKVRYTSDRCYRNSITDFLEGSETDDCIVY